MIKITDFKALLFTLALSAPLANAAPVVINFEDYDPVGPDPLIDFQQGTVVNNQYNYAEFGFATISAFNADGNGPDLAVAFDSTDTTPPAGVNDYDTDLVNPAGAPAGLGNILIIQENDHGCGTGTCSDPDDEGRRPAGVITIDFAGVIELLSIDFIDIELAENGTTKPTNAILLYDETDTLITFGTSNTEADPYPFHTPNTGDDTWGQVLFNSALDPELASIGKIEIFMGGSGAIDNITFSVVPVPASVWLFGSALLGFIGYSRRRMI